MAVRFRADWLLSPVTSSFVAGSMRKSGIIDASCRRPSMDLLSNGIMASPANANERSTYSWRDFNEVYLETNALISMSEHENKRVV